MPMQQQQSSLAAKLGAKITQAHQQHKDAPIDRGMVRLPGGIRNGIAQLNTAYVSQYKDGDNQGKDFFRASGVVKTPDAVGDQQVCGLTTSIMVPLCDQPKLRKPKTFLDNWFDFQNFFKLFGVNPPNETDPFKIEAYYMAAAKLLTEQKPHFSFSTREWTPPKSQLQPNPTPMVFEEWHGVAEYNGQADPSAGVSIGSVPPTEMAPEPFTEPPQGSADSSTPPADAPADADVGDGDPSELVAALVEAAMADAAGATEDGKAAIFQLEEMAKAAGATDAQIQSAADWGAVGMMALGELPDEQAADAPAVGSTHQYLRRSAKGDPLLNPKNKQPFPPIAVTVLTVDATAKTVTAKGADGKPIVDLKKNPVAIKWEWLQ